MKKITIYIIVILLVGLAGYFLWRRMGVDTSETNTNSGELADLQTGQAPWSSNTTHLKSRLTAIGLPQLSAEGTALHIHQHLDIFVHGEKVAVPSGIGIGPFGMFISELHTHDTTGIIHVEAPKVQTFTLGQFFDIWGLKSNAECIGGYCTDAANTLKLFVNGVQVTGNPRDVTLESHQEFVVIYGSDQEIPNPVPKEYQFPEGY